MFCTKCQNDLDDCTCPDLAERMRGLSGPGGFTVARWCGACDQHYAVCRCEVPDWRLRSDGVLRPLPAEVRANLSDLSGGSVT